LAEITDDRSLTLMVVEVDAAHAVHWMSPQDASEESILAAGSAAKPPHPGGAQAAYADGSIRYLSGKLQPAIVRALISIAGNDDAVARGADESAHEPISILRTSQSYRGTAKNL
jgi:prepilin-type processing-associated H-X9-DG protein